MLPLSLAFIIMMICGLVTHLGLELWDATVNWASGINFRFYLKVTTTALLKILLI